MKREVIDTRFESENMPTEIVILIPIISKAPETTDTFSERVVKLTTTSVGFYRAWKAHFYWLEFGTVSEVEGL